MSVLQDHARDVFIAAGLIADEVGVLPEAIAELVDRLDLGDMVHLEWTPRASKTDPHPTPKPPPPPPPPPPGKP